jgi:ATP-binding cassette subfamily B multidrug efflux pump
MSHYLWEMRPYFRQVAGQLVLGSIAGMIMNTAVVLPPILLGRAIDAALYLGATAAAQVMGFVTEYLTAAIAQGALRRLRVRLFARLQTLPLGHYGRTPLGDAISRCTADVETASTLFTTAAGAGRHAGDRRAVVRRPGLRDGRIRTAHAC